jgi:hypothetical protein
VTHPPPSIKASRKSAKVREGISKISPGFLIYMKKKEIDV